MGVGMAEPASTVPEVPAPVRGRAGWELALPGLIVFATAVCLAIFDGAFEPRIWYLPALFLLALLVLVGVLLRPQALSRSRLVTAALGLYAAFVGWSYLSILWADIPGAAWEGANRALFYGVAMAIVTAVPWRRGPATAVLALVAFGLGLQALAAVVLTSTSDDIRSLFLEGRLNWPIEYANATADLWLIGLFPALCLASSSALRWPLRGLALATACLLLQMAVLSQSRGAAVGFVVAVCLYIAFTPRRVHALLSVGLLVLLTALAFDTLVAVRVSPTVQELGVTMASAREAILISCIVAGVLGAAAAALQPRLPSRLSDARAIRLGNFAVAGVAIAGVVVALAAIGDPGSWAQDRWRDFKYSGYTRVDESANRFGSLGSGRYDYWRVALNEFRDHPVGGIGTDNFAGPYLEHRRTGQSPRHPHSLVFRLLAQGGVIGTALFAGFLGLLLWGFVRVQRRRRPADGVLAAGAFAGFAAWFVHGSADWLWEFPALAILALGLLLVAVGLEAPQRAGRALAERSTAMTAALLLGVLAAALAVSAPGVSARFTAAAYQEFETSPDETLARLERAADFDPLSAEPLIAKGVIARRNRRIDVARDALARSERREPSNWFVHYEQALLEGEFGSRERALREATRAMELNPRQALIGVLIRRLRAGKHIPGTAFEARLYGQLQARLQPTSGE